MQKNNSQLSILNFQLFSDPNGIPNNLMPFIAQTAVGKRESLSVFGGDYLNNSQFSTLNSPLITLKAFEKASNKHISYKIVERRAGDIAKCFADATYAKEVLNWEATKTIDEMCEDSWKWQMNNPDGYNTNEGLQ